MTDTLLGSLSVQTSMPTGGAVLIEQPSQADPTKRAFGLLSAGALSGGTSYTLPAATTAALGGVIPDGTTLVVNSSGVMAMNGQAPVAATTVPTLANLRVLLPDGTTLTGAQLQAILGTSGSSSTTPTPTPTATPTPGLGTHALVTSANGTGGATLARDPAFLAGSMLDIRVLLNASTYASGGLGALMDHWDGGNGFIAHVDSSGHPALILALNGTFINNTCGTALPAASNSDVWVRFAANMATTALGGVPAQTLRYLTSVDGEASYQQVGADVALPNAGPLATAAGTLVGINGGGQSGLNNAKARYAKLLVDNVAKITIDFSNATPGATSLTAATGQTVTIASPAAIQ